MLDLWKNFFKKFKELGFSGDELQAFVKEQQALERDKRAEARDAEKRRLAAETE